MTEFTVSEKLEESFNDANYVVGIGAPKAATSWIYQYFLKHPQVCSSPIKELHYFDAMYQPRYCNGFNSKFLEMYNNALRVNKFNAMLFSRLAMINDDDEYLNYFKMLYRGEKSFLEITPSYCMLDERVFRKIYSMHPKTKFIFIMRNPVDRIWSQIQFASRMRNKPLSAVAKVFESNDLKVVLRTDYRRTLTELYKAVPPSRVAILFYENLFTEESVKKLCDHVEVDYIPADFSKMINKTKYVQIEDERRDMYINILAPVYKYVIDNFKDVPASWLADAERISASNRSFYDDYSLITEQDTQVDISKYSSFQFKDDSTRQLVFGELCYSLQRYDEAEVALNESISSDWGQYLAHYTLSRLYKELGRIDSAISKAKDAIAVKDDNAHFYSYLGDLLKEKGDLDGAKEAQEKAIDLDPSSAGRHMQLSHIHNQLGNTEQAIQKVRDAIAIKADLPNFYSHLGSLLLKQGDFEGAKEAQEKAIALDPSTAARHMQLSYIYNQLGNTEQAIQKVQDAIAIKDDNPNFYSHLGSLLLKQGDLEGAKEAENKAIALAG